jgi:hypothetical protein
MVLFCFSIFLLLLLLFVYRSPLIVATIFRMDDSDVESDSEDIVLEDDEIEVEWYRFFVFVWRALLSATYFVDFVCKHSGFCYLLVYHHYFPVTSLYF